ncbi:hypothetical protein LVQ77_12745 [Buttiauxella sp. S04-F03]|uniref:hypothetical protein n=1 Tax=Buttiauxella sp. W03-F01 TaxID=2904524 RepID=UPI001E28E48E|nr:hypothetical protein [Buttiauxella sp. W03-F01]MCE0801157.1 hypothetical protein [Buttiauxella sp. W03-F01]
MGTQSGNASKKIYFGKVELANKFASSSETFGFDAEVQESYDDDLVDLQILMETQGYIEIYDPNIHGYTARYPLAKDSNSVPGSSPEYTGLYHMRLQSNSDVDPLVIVTFQGMIIDQMRYEKAVIETMITHDVMFGEKGFKNPDQIKPLRRFVRSTLDSPE